MTIPKFRMILKKITYDQLVSLLLITTKNIGVSKYVRYLNILIDVDHNTTTVHLGIYKIQSMCYAELANRLKEDLRC